MSDAEWRRLPLDVRFGAGGAGVEELADGVLAAAVVEVDRPRQVLALLGALRGRGGQGARVGAQLLLDRLDVHGWDGQPAEVAAAALRVQAVAGLGGRGAPGRGGGGGGRAEAGPPGAGGRHR